MRILYILLICLIYIAVGLNAITNDNAILGILFLISMYILLNK